jgi:2-C-methyl-D-erythritol 4-phosphate cytidylyltransferase
MKSNIPKQFLEISGKPILMITIERFFNYDNQINIILTLSQEMISYWEKLVKKHSFKISHQIVVGGETRFHSIQNAVGHISPDSITAVHDAVRPLLSNDTITRCFDKALELGNAVPFVSINESIREVNRKENIVADRNNFVLIQTPQVFKSEILIEAYQQLYSENFTDDASVIEKLHYKINLVEGNPENIKITNPQDLKIAEVLL